MITREGGMSRRRFLELTGATGAGVVLGGTTWVAKARTVRAQAKTTGKLSDYCAGDGSNETAKIQKCFDEHLIVEVDAPPGGVGYGFSGARGIVVRSGQEVRGTGSAKLIRVTGTSGKDPVNGGPSNHCFVNKDEANGSRSLVFDNLRILGQGRKDLDRFWNDNFSQVRLVGAAFFLATRRQDTVSRNITLTDVTILKWPGQSIRSQNIFGWSATRVYSRDPARGGHVLQGKLRHVEIHECASTESGDDSFALNSTMLGNGKPIVGKDLFAGDFEIWDCNTSTRESKVKNGGGNNGIALRGSQYGSIKRCKVFNPEKDGYTIQEYYGYRPKDILVLDCEARKVEQDGIGIKSSKTSGIRLQGNNIDGCKAYGTSWTTSRKGLVRFAGCEDHDTRVSRAGKGKRYIESNIKGIDVS